MNRDSERVQSALRHLRGIHSRLLTDRPSEILNQIVKIYYRIPLQLCLKGKKVVIVWNILLKDVDCGIIFKTKNTDLF